MGLGEKIKNLIQTKKEPEEEAVIIKPNGKKEKINWFKLTKLIYPVTITVIGVALIFVMYFLYQQVYQTAVQLDLVANLKSRVVEQQINKKTFNQVQQLFCRKTSTPALWPFKNPFVFSPLDPPANKFNPAMPTANFLNVTSTIATTSVTTTRIFVSTTLSTTTANKKGAKK